MPSSSVSYRKSAWIELNNWRYVGLRLLLEHRGFRQQLPSPPQQRNTHPDGFPIFFARCERHFVHGSAIDLCLRATTRSYHQGLYCLSSTSLVPSTATENVSARDQDRTAEDQHQEGHTATKRARSTSRTRNRRRCSESSSETENASR